MAGQGAREVGFGLPACGGPGRLSCCPRRGSPARLLLPAWGEPHSFSEFGTSVNRDSLPPTLRGTHSLEGGRSSSALRSSEFGAPLVGFAPPPGSPGLVAQLPLGGLPWPQRISRSLSPSTPTPARLLFFSATSRRAVRLRRVRRPPQLLRRWSWQPRCSDGPRFRSLARLRPSGGRHPGFRVLVTFLLPWERFQTQAREHEGFRRPAAPGRGRRCHLRLGALVASCPFR